MMMRITDNQYRIAKEDFVAEYPNLSQALLDRTLDNLSRGIVSLFSRMI